MLIKIARQTHSRRNHDIAIVAISPHPARNGIKMGRDILRLHNYTVL